MNSIKQLLAFLSTLWGLLGAAAVAFPGASTFLKVPIAPSDSNIGGLYPVIGTIVAAFAALFLVAYKKDLRALKFARKLAVWGILLGLFCFFSFVSTRLFLLDVYSEQHLSEPSKRKETKILRKPGVIQTEVYENDRLLSRDMRGDPFDVLALFFFAGPFASLSFGFTALGINAYQQKEP
jgi:hypothetical protein